MASTINILTIADFEGEFQVANTQYLTAQYTAKLQDDSYYQQFLSEIMGAELATLFIADLDTGEPQTAKWTAIFDPFTYTDNYGWITRCEGIKTMLIRQFWLMFAKDSIVTIGSNGAIVQGLENGKYDYSKFADINNRLYTNMRAFYESLILNPTDYPNVKTLLPCLATPF